MSNKKEKSNHLPSLQKLIVLHLAKNGPQTINQTAKGTGHDYHPSHTAFKALEKKRIIEKGKMKYLNIGKKFPLYWLTPDGAILALTEGASPTDILAIAKQEYPDNLMLQFGLEMGQYANVEVFKIALTALRAKGKLELADLISIMITQMRTDTPMKTFTDALKTYRKYPEQYSQFKKSITQIKETFNKLTENI